MNIFYNYGFVIYPDGERDTLSHMSMILPQSSFVLLSEVAFSTETRE